MSTISAALVMQLRQRSGAGMMDCKKVLIATGGDIEQAIIELRKSGQAGKKADRIAAEGIVVIAHAADKRTAVMVEINSETDFAARAENFVSFANNVATTALKTGVNDIDALSDVELLGSDTSIEQARQELVAVIGENIKLRRLVRMQVEDGVVGCYLHGTRIGVLVAMKQGDENIAKDIAMHIAASRPLVVNRDQVSREAIETERDIFTAQARESGKPQEIIDKMIEGRISKFVDEVCLAGQPFVKDPNIKVGQYLKDKHAQVDSFVRFEVGEGIEKKEDNFVEEVMAQVREQ
jgi:elongation factor Ts